MSKLAPSLAYGHSPFMRISKILEQTQHLSNEEKRREYAKHPELFREVARRMSRVKITAKSRPSLESRGLEMGEAFMHALQLLQLGESEAGALLSVSA